MLCRAAGSARAAARAFSAAGPTPIIELREYKLREATFLTEVQGQGRSAGGPPALPLRLFTMPDTGGQLNVATHFYSYEGGTSQRDAVRGAARRNQDWLGYLAGCDQQSRPEVLEQRSTLFVEAPLVAEFGLHGMRSLACPSGHDATVDGSSSSPQSIYEIRRYQLQLGYDTVPNFLQLYQGGLPSKLAAPNTDPSTSLVTLMYNEVGRLNEVIEVWRHGGGSRAMDTSRQAARAAAEWRGAIGQIAGLAVEFTSTIHKPLPFSPWQ